MGKTEYSVRKKSLVFPRQRMRSSILVKAFLQPKLKVEFSYFPKMASRLPLTVIEVLDPKNNQHSEGLFGLHAYAP